MDQVPILLWLEAVGAWLRSERTDKCFVRCRENEEITAAALDLLFGDLHGHLDRWLLKFR